MRSQAAATYTIPAPVGGLNSRDAKASMRASDATTLDNWWPLPSALQLRKGYSNHVTGSGQFESLLPYHGATPKLFAAASTAIYDVTSAGALGAAVVSSLTNARWQHTSFGTSAAYYLVICNGADSVRTWDGSAWATPAITGVTSSTLISVCSHVQRLFFAKKDTLSVWYLPAGAVAGAAAEIDLAPYAQLGGSLSAVASWTVDGGVGIDDHFVAITTKGEVLVFKGSDPASASTWVLVGVFRLGAPVGRRCFVRVGGELLVLTQDGVVALSSSLISDRSKPERALSDKIRDSILTETNAYSAQFGWQLSYYPGASMLICNAPRTEGSLVNQYVMNTQSGAWARFTGWNANCFAVFNDSLYFGMNGAICKAWDTNADNGAVITALGRQAYSAFGAPGQNKRFTMARPLMSANGTPSVAIGVNLDFIDTDPDGQATYAASDSAGVWGTGVWGSMKWGGGALRQFSPHVSLSGIGQWGSVVVKAVSSGIDVRWHGTVILAEKGGFL